MFYERYENITLYLTLSFSSDNMTMTILPCYHVVMKTLYIFSLKTSQMVGSNVNGKVRNCKRTIVAKLGKILLRNSPKFRISRIKNLRIHSRLKAFFAEVCNFAYYDLRVII
jgi:hypothetical protein